MKVKYLVFKKKNTFFIINTTFKDIFGGGGGGGSVFNNDDDDGYCHLCDRSFKGSRGLAIHNGMMHKNNFDGYDDDSDDDDYY
jgi:hypothetical protein